MQATVTEVQETDPSISYSTSVTTLTNAGYSGGTAVSISVGKTATFTFTGHALYLVTATDPTFGVIDATVDGVQTVYGVPCWNGAHPQALAQRYYGVLVPLFRAQQDGTHTVVLGSRFAGIPLDSFLVLSGPKGTPTPGNYVNIGDSWCDSGGASNGGTTGVAGWNQRLVSLLEGYYRRPFTHIKKGAGGDCWFATDRAVSGGSIRAGGMWRTFADAVPNTPEVLTYLYGPNDLRWDHYGASPYDWARHMDAALCFCEDAFDVSQMKVAVATPGYLAAQAMFSTPNVNGGGMDNWQGAVIATHHVAAQHPWVNLAQVFEAMDGNDALVYPNSLGDTGVHPNDAGHGVIAAEFFRALTGGVG